MKICNTLTKQSIVCLLTVLCFSFSNCTGTIKDENDINYLDGTVTKTDGTPIEGVKIIVDNSIFFNSNMSTLTNSEGKYRISVTDGSWYAFAQHEVNYNNKIYRFYLHPQNNSGFGAEGGERNFEWKLSGEMREPLSGYYGGLVTIDRAPGTNIDIRNIQFLFTPTGNLIDGSEGSILLRQASDGYSIRDLPMGRYIVTATYINEQVRFRKWASDDSFTENFLLDFEPVIDAQCDNCAKLEIQIEN